MPVSSPKTKAIGLNVITDLNLAFNIKQMVLGIVNLYFSVQILCFFQIFGGSRPIGCKR